MTRKKEGRFRSCLVQASGAALGLSIGVIGPLSPIGALMIIGVLLFRCRLSWALMASVVGWGLSKVYDPSSLGFALLNLEVLRPLWREFYNTPFLAISGFNETRVMGGITFGIGAFVSLMVFLSVKGDSKPATPIEDEVTS